MTGVAAAATGPRGALRRQRRLVRRGLFGVLVLLAFGWAGPGSAIRAEEPEELVRVGPCRLVRQGKKDPNQVKLLYYGDSGTGEQPEYIVASAMARLCHDQCCDAALAAGDNIYPRGVRSADDQQFETKWERPMAPILNPQGGPLLHYMSLGNHDAYGNVQAEIDRTRKSLRWRMPARYYEVPALPSYLSVFVIDSTRTTPEQTAWLTQAACGSRARWKFLLGHHPVISAGSHGSNSSMRYLLDVAARCGVTGYLAGHDHDLQHVTIVLPNGQPFEQFVSGSVAYRRDDVAVCPNGAQPEVMPAAAVGAAAAGAARLDAAGAARLDAAGAEPRRRRRRCRKTQAKLEVQAQGQGARGAQFRFSHVEHGFAVLTVSPDRYEVAFYDGQRHLLYRHPKAAPAPAAPAGPDRR